MASSRLPSLRPTHARNWRLLGRFVFQRGIEDERRGAVDLDLDRAHVGLQLGHVVGNAGQEAGQFIAVVQQQAVRVAGRPGQAVQELVAIGRLRRQMENDAGERFQRKLERAQNVRIDGEPFLVGGDDLGHQQRAVVENQRPSPALLRASSPADQVGRRHGERFADRCRR